MNRLLAKRVTVVLAVVAAACGAGADTTTTVPPATLSSVAPTTAAPETTAVPGTTPTTTSPAGTVDVESTECLRVWPEERVRDVVGDSFALFSSSPDGLVCVFGSGTNSVAILIRPGDQSLFEQAKERAGLAGGAEDQAICDAGYSTDVGGITVVEALDLDVGSIYNVALSGIDDPIAAATTLLGDACS